MYHAAPCVHNVDSVLAVGLMTTLALFGLTDVVYWRDASDGCPVLVPFQYGQSEYHLPPADPVKPASFLPCCAMEHSSWGSDGDTWTHPVSEVEVIYAFAFLSAFHAMAY